MKIIGIRKRASILSLLFFMLLSVSAKSQILEKPKYNFADRPNEVSLGVGFVLTPFSIVSYDRYYAYDKDKNYRGNIIGTPAINAYYGYAFKKWLHVGVIVTYAGSFEKIYSRFDNNMVCAINRTHVGFTPNVRFVFLNKKYVRLYSSVGLGLAYKGENNKNFRKNEQEYSKWATLTINLNCFGISVGNKLFGYYEAAIGSSGFVRTGIGYRF